MGGFLPALITFCRVLDVVWLLSQWLDSCYCISHYYVSKHSNYCSECMICSYFIMCVIFFSFIMRVVPPAPRLVRARGSLSLVSSLFPTNIVFLIGICKQCFKILVILNNTLRFVRAVYYCFSKKCFLFCPH